MPMIPPALGATIGAAYQAQGSEAETAKEIAGAISDFWSAAMAGFGNAVANGGSVKGALASALEAVYLAQEPDEATVAKQIADAIDEQFLTLMTSGPAIHLSISAFGKSALASELEGIYKSQLPDPTLVAMQEALAIYNYSTNSLVQGLMPAGPAMVPVAAPLA
jgi:hypothetical protein